MVMCAWEMRGGSRSKLSAGKCGRGQEHANCMREYCMAGGWMAKGYVKVTEESWTPAGIQDLDCCADHSCVLPCTAASVHRGCWVRCSKGTHLTTWSTPALEKVLATASTPRLQHSRS